MECITKEKCEEESRRRLEAMGIKTEGKTMKELEVEFKLKIKSPTYDANITKLLAERGMKTPTKYDKLNEKISDGNKKPSEALARRRAKNTGSMTPSEVWRRRH